MAALFVSNIEALGVNPKQPFHSGNQVRQRSLDHQVEMIAHQAISMDLPFSLAACLRQGTQKSFPIKIVTENSLATISAIHNVINRAGIFDSQLSRHRARDRKRTRLNSSHGYIS